MVKLVMGSKQGVGQFVKVLKYNTDNALTLANDAYSRYVYNSENQAISYVFEPKSWNFEYYGYPPQGVHNIDSGKYYLVRSYFTNQRDDVGVFAVKDEISPNTSYVPIFESRFRNDNGWIIGGQRQFKSIQGAVGVITASQFMSVWAKTLNFSTGQDWQTRFPSGLSFLGYGKWVASCSNYAGSNAQVTIPKTVQIGTQTYLNTRYVTAFWDLPADSSPLPVYNYTAGLKGLIVSPTQAIMSRPGYTWQGSSGRSQRIFDSTQAPCLCVMSGDTPSIASGATVTIPVPYGYTLSENAIVEMLPRNVSAEFYQPCLLQRGDESVNATVWYKIDAGGLTIWNESQQTIIVRYMVFDADTRPNTTGGKKVLSREVYNGQEYIRLKKPGTSDTTTQPNDIIIDTRLPMVQIVKEGFIPTSSFSSTGAEDTRWLGERQFTVNFTNDGFLPFVKYSLVFNDYILPPVQATRSGTSDRGPSNQSSMCRLGDNYAKFWINPGNWSRVNTSAPTSSNDIYDQPDPIGIRYYIFAITRP